MNEPSKVFLNDESAKALLDRLNESHIGARCLSFVKSRPYIGREHLFFEAECRLGCMYKANLLITGASGVGKTTFVHQLAKRLNARRQSRNSAPYIYEIHVAALLADTRYRGEFEKRVTTLFEAVAAYENVVCFFDEAHTMRTTGGESGIGMMDIIKPVLLMPNTKVILATTPSEAQVLLQDAAFARRFHRVSIEDLSDGEKLEAAAAHLGLLSTFHGVAPPAWETVVRLVRESPGLTCAIDEIDYLLSKERLLGYESH